MRAQRRSILRIAFLICLLFALACVGANAQYADTDLHDFNSNTTDGYEPHCAVAIDGAGNFYGTTRYGGANDSGMVWEQTAGGAYIDLYDFGGVLPDGNDDGYEPYAGVAIDAHGNLYGTTYGGGANYRGIVWELTRGGVYSDLHDFGGTLPNGNEDGANPYAGVTLDTAGDLYGTTLYGGANYDGIVWGITASSAYVDLHDFGGQLPSGSYDGEDPYSGVTLDTAGNLYGTATYGGGGDDGIVWELTNSGTYQDLHDFGRQLPNGSYDGEEPYSGVTIDRNGNLFGTAYDGGANFEGIVWELTASGGYADLHDFGALMPDGSYDGYETYGGVTVDAMGDLFGTTEFGGETYDGIVWELTSVGSYVELYNFGASTTDGEEPDASVTFDSSGNLYGTTAYGGADSSGMLWMLPPPPPVASVATSRDPGPAIAGGVGVSFTATLSVPAAFAGGSVTLTSSDSTHILVDGAASDTFTLGAGAGSQTFTISAPADVVTDTPVFLVASSPGLSSSSTAVTVKPFINPSYPPPGELAGIVFGNYNVQPGASISGTVHVFEAPATDQAITISTGSSPFVTLTGPVTVQAGKNHSSVVTFAAGPVNTYEPIAVTATAPSGISSASTSFTVNAPVFRNATFAPNPVTAGDNEVTVTATVNLSGPVLAQSQMTLYSENIGMADNVTICFPAGSSVGTGTVFTHNFVGTGESSVGFVTYLTASGTYAFAGRLYLYPDALKSIVFNQSSVNAGTTATATVTVTAATVAAQEFDLSLNTSPPTTVPVTIPGGQTSATVNVPTPYAFGSSPRVYELSGSINLSSAHATISVTPNSITAMNLSCPNLGANITRFSELDTVQLNVQLAFPAPNGATIPVTSTLNGIVAPFSVTVAAGQSTGSATFTPTFTALAAARAMTLYAVYGTKMSEAVTVNPEVVSLTLQPSTIDGGQSTTATITLFDNAPPGSAVTATVHSSTATLVGSSTIPITGNGLTYTFTVKANPRPAPANPVPVVIQITGLGYSRTATLTIDHS